MKRRTLLTAAAGLALPAIARAQGTPGSTQIVKFIPQADLGVLDPHWTTAYGTRTHAFMVFDTLYGTNGQFKPSPQMVAGHTVDHDGKLWRLTLRDGLKFHDNQPVLATDCVASIYRWGRRDPFGQALLAATDQLSAEGDKVIVFRLKHPFPLLPDALGKTTAIMPAMMPARLAATHPDAPVPELVGSGPFRFMAQERRPGALAVYARFTEYRPCTTGVPDWNAGPKVARFDRVEWHAIPDPAAAAEALQNGEMDWWECPAASVLPELQANRYLKVSLQDPTGQVAILRMNQLQPPFDNPAIRRALLGAVNQADVMQAVAGPDHALWRDGVGVFCPGTPLANTAGLGALTGPRDPAKVKADLAAAGYQGERVAVLVPTDVPALQAMAAAGVTMLQQAGLTVDAQAMDWGTVLSRRTSQAPVDQGGWSVFFTAFAGTDMLNPANHLPLRGNGLDAWFGWPTAPALEDLRAEWFADPDLAAQQATAAKLQQQALTDVPYIPLGQYLQPTAYRASLQGVLNGFPLFWNAHWGL